MESAPHRRHCPKQQPRSRRAAVAVMREINTSPHRIRWIAFYLVHRSMTRQERRASAEGVRAE
jgi:hypothetical protein